MRAKCGDGQGIGEELRAEDEDLSAGGSARVRGAVGGRKTQQQRHDVWPVHYRLARVRGEGIVADRVRIGVSDQG